MNIKKNEEKMVQRVFCYNKLFALLREKQLKQKDLEEKAGVSSSTLNKLSHGKNVNTEMLEKICTALDCELADIVETRTK